MAKEKVIIFDTTLRDGEQSPGASLTAEEKLKIARQLKLLGVDVIEAGFPISSKGDFTSVRGIAQHIKGPAIAGLARALKKDIDCAWEAVKYSKKPRIHVFLATSPIHMKYKLRKAKEEILRLAKEATGYAKHWTEDIEFSPEDASRTEIDFLCQVIEQVIKAGATTVNIPDTVGYAVPEQFGDLIRRLFEKVDNINRAIVSVHCHNDLGLATANTLAALENGARQVECTINGIGERAGNASLEEIVMALKTRKEFFNLETNIITRQLYPTSKMVSNLTGLRVQRNKAIVGENAFSHEAGIHQDGILKKRTTYEIMNPKDIGWPTTRLVLGKHSGRHAFAKRLSELGYKISQVEMEKAFGKFKALADRKKEIFDEDLKVIVEEEMTKVKEIFSLEYIHISSGNHTVPTATIRLKRGKQIIQEAACGDGPVDAVYRAIDRVTGLKCKLLDYRIRAVSEGKDALGEVNVKISGKPDKKGREVTVVARRTSTDIIEASARAYINAVNRILAVRREA